MQVFHAAPDWKDPDADRPVDIYAPDGQLLFSGFAPATDWTAAHGDFVYGTALDPIIEESRVYRWRLEVPYN